MVDNEKFKEEPYDLSYKTYSWDYMKLFLYTNGAISYKSKSFTFSYYHFNSIIYLKIIKNVGYFKGKCLTGLKK